MRAHTNFIDMSKARSRRGRSLPALLILCACLAGCGAPITSRQARDGVQAPETYAPSTATPRDPHATDMASLALAASELPEPRRSVVEVALAMAGARARKFDCSSFAQHVYASSQTTLPRTTLQQFEVGQGVNASDLRAGDLVFFAFSRRPVDHVGIYTGRGSFVHVSSSTRTVRLETLSKAVFAESVVGGRRVLGP